jgi:hypothetical protein
LYTTSSYFISFQCVASLSDVDAKLMSHSLTAVAAHRNHAAHRKPLNNFGGADEKTE